MASVLVNSPCRQGHPAIQQVLVKELKHVSTGVAIVGWSEWLKLMTENSIYNYFLNSALLATPIAKIKSKSNTQLSIKHYHLSD